MRYLVDTGVLLRALDRNDPAHLSIVTVLGQLRTRGHTLMTATQNLREFWNVSTRPSTARGGYGRTVEDTSRRLLVLERLFQVVAETPATFARWKEVVNRHQVIGTQVHDANLVAIIDVYEIDQLLTLNASDFQRYSRIRATTPANLLSRINDGDSNQP